MTNNTIQQRPLKYDLIAVNEVEQHLNSGYCLYGDPVYDYEHGRLRQAVVMHEPLAVQRLLYKKRRVYAMYCQNVKRADIAKAVKLEPRTVTDYLAFIKRLINE